LVGVRVLTQDGRVLVCVGCCLGAVSQSSDSTDQRWADAAYGHIPIPSSLTSMSAVRSEEPAERDSIQPKASSSTIDKSVCMHMPIRQSVSDGSIGQRHSCQCSDGGPDDTHKHTHTHTQQRTHPAPPTHKHFIPQQRTHHPAPPTHTLPRQRRTHAPTHLPWLLRYEWRDPGPSWPKTCER